MDAAGGHVDHQYTDLGGLGGRVGPRWLVPGVGARGWRQGLAPGVGELAAGTWGVSRYTFYKDLLHLGQGVQVTTKARKTY